MEPSDFTIRPAAERGRAQHGWLDSHHSFSFGHYYDPKHLGFRSLQVINQDRVVAGAGFPKHPHKNMEIFSYVLEGTLRHEDSLGNQRDLLPGQIQLMSAGSGITHSEFNPSRSEGLHFLQIWIEPRAEGLPPAYTEWHPSAGDEQSAKVLVIAPDGRDGAATIRQDALVYRLRLGSGEKASHSLVADRGMWLQVISGALRTKGSILLPGDGFSTDTAGEYELLAGDAAVEALLFDLK